MSVSTPTRARPRWWRPYRRFDRFVGQREAHVFRLLSNFFPDTAIARSRRLQHLLFSKALSDAARDSAKYAAVVAVVASSGSVFESSLMTIAMLLPIAMFGFYAGEVADSMSRRIVIGAAYGAAGVACFVIPTVFGTGVAPLLALVFLVSAFGQFASPAENSVVALVANEREVASANSMLGLASSLGSGFGIALLAPLLLKLTSPTVVFYVAGLLSFAAATRVLHVYSKRDPGSGVPRPHRGTDRQVLTWLFSHRSVATMVCVAVLTGMSNIFMAALAPVYVRDVLKSDPANTVFVLGPAGIASTASLLLVPVFIRWKGERATAAVGFGLVVLALVALGLVGHELASLIDPVNPMRLLGLVGFDVSSNVRTAAWLSVPLGLGSGLTDNSVKTYINRRVPLAYQGRTFAAKSVLQSGLSVGPLIVVSGLASLVGVSTILVLTPISLYVLILGLVYISRLFGAEPLTPRGLVFSTFWEEADETAFAQSPS